MLLHLLTPCPSMFRYQCLTLHLECWPLSELLELLGVPVPSRWIEQLPASGRPLTAPVMVGVPTARTTTTIPVHPSMASAIGMGLQATGALPSTGAPLSAMTTPTAYTRPAYSPYTSHAPSSGPASARPVCEAVGQPSSTCIDPVIDLL